MQFSDLFKKYTYSNINFKIGWQSTNREPWGLSFIGSEVTSPHLHLLFCTFPSWTFCLFSVTAEIKLGLLHSPSVERNGLEDEGASVLARLWRCCVCLWARLPYHRFWTLLPWFFTCYYIFNLSCFAVSISGFLSVSTVDIMSRSKLGKGVSCAL